MPKDKYRDLADAIYEKLWEYSHLRLKEKIKGNIFVSYSGYTTDRRGIPVNNIDQVAMEGEFTFYQKHDPFWGEGEDYRSVKPMKNPTWLTVARHANEMIKTTGDKHHIYLEGIHVLEDGVLGFVMGS